MTEPIEPADKTKAEPVPQRAIWFFLAATFVFVAPIIVLPDAELWFRVVTVVAGSTLIIVGGVFLTREMRAARDRRIARDQSGQRRP